MRRLVLVAFLLALVGCQLGATDEPAPTSTTSARDALRAKLERLSTSTTSFGLTNDVVRGRVSPTTQPREGDGICTHEERDGGVDCRQRSARYRQILWIGRAGSRGDLTIACLAVHLPLRPLDELATLE